MRIRKIFSYFAVTASGIILAFVILFSNYRVRNEKRELINGTNRRLTNVETSDTAGERLTRMHDESVTQGVCKGTVVPLHLVSADTWYQMDEKRSVYVFSAFMKRSQKMVYIIGARLKSLKMHTNLQCQLWRQENNTITMEVSNAYFAMPSELHNKKFGPDTHRTCNVNVGYTSTMIQCSLKSTLVPTYVSLAIKPCSTPLNLMKIEDATRPEVYKYNFTVCLSPLYHFDDVHRLVEWFELNRILGAEQFIVYNNSMSVNVDNVLRHYSRQGIVKIIQWQPPMKIFNGTSEIHYLGQVSALNDCLFRCKGSSEFLVNIDLDEFIIPHKDNTTDWKSLLRKIEKPNVTVYIFRSTFFLSQDDNNKTIIPEKELVEKFELDTLRRAYHESKIYPSHQRTKYIVRTNGVDRVETHTVPRVPKAVVQEDVGLVHHYRNWAKKSKHNPVNLVHDDTVKQRFGQNLIKNVVNVWKQLAHLPVIHNANN